MANKKFFDHNLYLRFISTAILAPLVLWVLSSGILVTSLLILPLVFLLGKEWIEMIKHKKRLKYYVFGALYIIIPASAIIYLAGRSTDPYSLSRIACLVWASDIGAYIVGRWIGGPRINAKISPNKTWSGYYGGLLLTTLTGYFLSIPIPLAALISLLAQLGDLGESAIKRYFGITNSGNIIPGHGGIMDRFDSFVLVSVFLAISDFATRLIYG